MGGASLAKLEQKVLLSDGFLANVVKIGRFNVRKLDFGYRGIGLGQREHFEAGKLQNLLKIGVASHEVGVAKDKVGGAAAPPVRPIAQLVERRNLDFIPGASPGSSRFGARYIRAS